MSRTSIIRSFSRLLVGSVLTGIGGLANRLEAWERENLPSHPEIQTPGSDKTSGSDNPTSEVQFLSDSSSPVPENTLEDRLGHTLIGWAFEQQDRMPGFLDTADRATRVIGNWVDLVYGPIYRSRWMSPLRSPFDRLIIRGETEVQRWQAIGRDEAAIARQLAQSVMSENIDSAIEYLTANEEVQELVQSQSAGLVDEVIVETRERTISADTYLETLVRSLFHKPHRAELPESPQIVQLQANEHHRQLRGKSIKK